MAARGATIAFRRPTPAAIASFLAGQQTLPLSYERPPGGVMNPPSGFVADHRRRIVGHGERDFDAARDAVRRWKPFDLGWVEVVPDTTPIAVGEVVAVLTHLGPTWWLNATRIVEVIDEAGPPRRFGFAYGTLPGHAECGEERFLVEQLADATVWYDLRAFSRPQSRLAALGYPLARVIQRRFSAGSAAAVERAVARAREVEA